MQLRPYQHKFRADIEQAWTQGAQNVVARLDTGGGKTAVLSEIHRDHPGASAVIAHRQELVSQLSLSLARNGVRHNIIASDNNRRAIAREHLDVLGVCYFEPSAPCVVASVDTLIRAKGLESWAQQVTLWTVDEGHHLVEDNKWHRAICKFAHPLVRGLLPTATPQRADGKGLGRGQGGVADAMIEGPPMRWLIEQGYLTDYEIYCAQSDLDVIAEVGESGDWSSAQLREAAKRSHIVGDVVKSYLRFAPNKLGITFATDIDTAIEISAAYNAAGVRAETLTGKTESGARRSILRQFAARQVMQIVAVDIISEGFDLPALEVGSFARPTQSLARYMQQFGRLLRPLEGKSKAIIIDHVGSVVRHLVPDRPRSWSLNACEARRGRQATLQPRICLNCYMPYERYLLACPRCGEYPEPQGRASPQQVDGDLVLLEPAALAALRGDLEAFNLPPGDYARRALARGVPPIGLKQVHMRHEADHEAQGVLRKVMARWCGKYHAEGLSDREIQKKFYLTYSLDILSAQTVRSAEAGELEIKLREEL